MSAGAEAEHHPAQDDVCDGPVGRPLAVVEC